MVNLYSPFAVTASLILVVLLLALLICKELLRATGHPRFDAWGRILNFAILPLTVAFFLIVIVRFVALLPN